MASVNLKELIARLNDTSRRTLEAALQRAPNSADALLAMGRFHMTTRQASDAV